MELEFLGRLFHSTIRILQQALTLTVAHKPQTSRSLVLAGGFQFPQAGLASKQTEVVIISEMSLYS